MTDADAYSTLFWAERMLVLARDQAQPAADRAFFERMVVGMVPHVREVERAYNMVGATGL